MAMWLVLSKEIVVEVTLRSSGRSSKSRCEMHLVLAIVPAQVEGDCPSACSPVPE